MRVIGGQIIDILTCGNNNGNIFRVSVVFPVRSSLVFLCQLDFFCLVVRYQVVVCHFLACTNFKNNVQSLPARDASSVSWRFRFDVAHVAFHLTSE